MDSGFIIHFDGKNWQEIDTFSKSEPLCITGINGKATVIAGANGWSAVKNTKASKRVEEKERLGKYGKYGHTELHKAVSENNIKKINIILNKGIDVNIIDNLGRTPLHYAAVRGYTKIAELLLDKGADINAVDKVKQWTPLFYAAFMNHKKMVDLLIEKGADQTIKDKFNRTVSDYIKN